MPNLFDLPKNSDPKYKSHKADARVLPMPFDATTSYRGGCALGPAAIIEASHQVDLYDSDFGSFEHYKIDCLEISQEILDRNQEVKSLIKLSKNINSLTKINNKITYDFAKSCLENDQLPVIIGGDHSVPLGQILAIDEKFDNYGIFHIDAHADLRENYQGFEDSHASIFYNVIKQTKSLDKLVQVGVRDFCEEELSLINNNKKLIKTYFDSDLRKPRLNGKILKKIKKIISKLPKHVYVSVDIDGLNPTLCPNTGTPVPGGLSFDEFCEFIKEIRESGRKIIGLDLCEVTPIGENSWDAIVGARVLFKLLGFALCQKNT